MANDTMKQMSPESMLENAMADIKKSGFEGLKPYLTPEALNKAQTFLALADGFGMFGGMGMNFMMQPNNGGSPSSSGGSIKEKMKECEYIIKDITEDSANAKAVVEFNFKDSKKGTAELFMIKEDGEWKINNMDMPQFN